MKTQFARRLNIGRKQCINVMKYGIFEWMQVLLSQGEQTGHVCIKGNGNQAVNKEVNDKEPFTVLTSHSYVCPDW